MKSDSVENRPQTKNRPETHVNNGLRDPKTGANGAPKRGNIVLKASFLYW